MPGVLQAAVEGQQREEADDPQRDTDLDGPDAVDVERLDVGDEVGAVADLVGHRLVVAQLHGATRRSPPDLRRPPLPVGHALACCRP